MFELGQHKGNPTNVHLSLKKRLSISYRAKNQYNTANLSCQSTDIHHWYHTTSTPSHVGSQAPPASKHRSVPNAEDLRRRRNSCSPGEKRGARGLLVNMFQLCSSSLCDLCAYDVYATHPHHTKRNFKRWKARSNIYKGGTQKKRRCLGRNPSLPSSRSFQVPFRSSQAPSRYSKVRLQMRVPHGHIDPLGDEKDISEVSPLLPTMPYVVDENESPLADYSSWRYKEGSHVPGHSGLPRVCHILLDQVFLEATRDVSGFGALQFTSSTGWITLAIINDSRLAHQQLQPQGDIELSGVAAALAAAFRDGTSQGLEAQP